MKATEYKDKFQPLLNNAENIQDAGAVILKFTTEFIAELMTLAQTRGGNIPSDAVMYGVLREFDAKYRSITRRLTWKDAPILDPNGFKVLMHSGGIDYDM